MDPVVAALVSALSAGALALGQGYATEAIKDSYKALKGLIIARFADAIPFLNAVEKRPESEPAQRVLADELTPAAGDLELKTHAAALLAAMQSLKSDPRAAAVFDFQELEAAGNFKLDDIVFSGTLLRVAGKARFEKDFEAKGLRQGGNEPGAEKKTV